jgi:hypothetical protein
MMASIQGWIETHLRLQVNATKSGVGRVWERKFLGFRLNRAMQIEAAPESLERFKAKVREKWRSCQVGVLPTGREPPPDLSAGALDSPTCPEMLLAAVARTGRERTAAAQPGIAGTHAESGAEFPGSLASGEDRQPAKRALERDSTPLWLSHAIGSRGLLTRGFQPPDVENRTSGGVGGCRGVIPVTRPDR